MVYNALMAWSRSQAEAKKAVIEAASKMPNGGGLFLLDALTALDQTTVPDYILNILEKPASKPIDLGMLPFENSEWFIGSSSGAGSIWLKWKLDPNIKFTDTAIIDRTMKGGGRILSVEGPHQGASGWHFNSDVKPFSYLDHAPTPVIGPGLKYVAKGFVWAGLAVDAGDLYTSFQADGWSFGPNAQHAVGRVGGGWGGAAAGAIIGSAFGPTGTLIGGILGGIFGSWAGGSLVN